MMYIKNILFFWVCFICFFSADATFKTHLQKTVTLTLPYYPSLFHWIHQDQLVRPRTGASFYYGTHDTGQIKNSLMYGAILNNPAGSGLPALDPYAYEQAIINKEPELLNPFYDAPIVALDSFGIFPVVVTDLAPTSVCMAESIVSVSCQKIHKTPPLHDADGNPSQSISALSVGITGTQDTRLNCFIFAALNNNDIAVIKYDYEEVEEVVKNGSGKEVTQKKKDYFFNVLDAQTGDDHGNKACRIPHELLSINQGNGSYTIKNLYWCQHAERLYVALDVKTNADNAYDQGYCALAVGRIDEQERLCFDKIAQDSLLSNDAIITAIGPNNRMVIHKVNSLMVTMGLNYLLINGGVENGNGQTTKKLYALPVTVECLMIRKDVMNCSTHGIIASKNCNFNRLGMLIRQRNKLIRRSFASAPDSLETMLTSNDRATLVGAGKELPNAITDIFTERDTVFITVAQPGAGQQPGIFHSQAILDGLGKIAAWTPWQRVAGVQEGVATARISKEEFSVSYLKAEKPEFVCQINFTIPPKSEYLEEDAKKGDLSDFVDQTFSRSLGGIQGLYDFPSSTRGFSAHNPLSMLVMVGYKKIALVETGNNNDEALFTAYKEGFTKQCIVSNNGTIPFLSEKTPDERNQPRVVIIEGSVLDQLGALTQAVIVHDQLQSWLVIAGPRGAAVLCHEDGSGWCNEPGLAEGFVGMHTMAFKKFGNWNYIKKIVSFENHLYILTNKSLERINLCAHDVCNGAPSDGAPSDCTVLIRGDVTNALFDVGISGPLAIVATSQGLLVNTEATDCRRDDQTSLAWRTIELPQSNGPVYNLFFVSCDGKKNGFCHGGQVYASTGSLLENSTNIYRLYIHDVVAEGVTNTSVELVPDQLYMDIGSPFIRCTSFRDHFATNGVHYFSARSRQTDEKPVLQLISMPVLQEYRFLGHTVQEEQLAIGKVTKNITALVQNSATGNWLIGGDFGLRIHN